MEKAYGKDFDGKKKTPKEQLEYIKKMKKITEGGNPLKNPFGETDEEAFASKIDGMNLCDVQSLCIKASVPPSGTRPFLRRKLKTEFSKFLVKNKDRLNENN